MNIIAYLFPDGKNKALTTSYDDGVTQDIRLVDIFNAHGIRGSFHVNAGLLGHNRRIPAADIATVYAGHEVSCHGLTHPSMHKIPLDQIAIEIVQDRRILEDLVGYPIRGMSYPNGSYDQRVVALLPSLGIEYARTVHAHGRFTLPENFLTWPATCHHNMRLLELTDEFLALGADAPASLLYLWGHAYEFDADNNWDLIEEFSRRVGRNNSVWYATNIEIVDYLTAVRALRFSADQTMAFNPSSQPVWILSAGTKVKIDVGQTVRLT